MMSIMDLASATDASVSSVFEYSIRRTEEVDQEMAEEEEIYELNNRQLMVGQWAPRVMGTITLISSICTIYMAWQRRSKLFHRLVLGMAFYQLMYGLCLIVGVAAVPSSDHTNNDHTNNAVGNVGTITTCTIQGFLLQLSSFTAAAYYCSFSAYSYVGVLNNFKRSKINWIEKYIHVLVHIFPIASAAYLVSAEAFNNSGFGFCLIESDPLDECGRARLIGSSGQNNSANEGNDDSDGDSDSDSDTIACGRRGPEYDTSVFFWIFTFPIIVEVVVTTVIMIVLYFMVRRRQETVRIHAKTVALQAAVYLSALYGALVPILIIEVILVANGYYHDGRGSFTRKNLETIHGWRVFEYFNWSLFSLWTMLAYRYFSIEKTKKTEDVEVAASPPIAASTISAKPHNSTTIATATAAAAANPSSCDENNNSSSKASSLTTTNDTGRRTAMVGGYIFSSQEIIEKINDDDDDDDQVQVQTTAATTPQPQHAHHQNKSEQLHRAYSFNIFDGTDASGAFAEFIHEGDSDDEREDHQETLQWNAVQNHI